MAPYERIATRNPGISYSFYCKPDSYKQLQTPSSTQTLHSPSSFTISEIMVGFLTASKVIGVIVLARNGDRAEYYQDPKTYAGSFTETTPLGEVIALYSFSLLTFENPLGSVA
jgi:hypothetical protein